MAGLSLTRNKLSGPKEKFSVKNLPAFLGQWFIRNKFYFLAFAVPVIIMYVAYALFEVSPYGDNSVLVLDLNGQYVYYFEAIRDAFWGEESMLYNWSRNLSGGYMGIIGYYLASPLTLIPILLPRTMLLGSLLIMILVKLGLASVTFSYLLQKSKGVAPLQATVFSTLYALCAYGVIQAMNPMWLDGVYLLPLIVLGVEYLIDDGRKLNLIIPLAMIFVFNFYIGYIVAIFTLLYFIFYLFSGRNENGKKLKGEDYFNIFIRAVIAVGTAVLCSAFMILSVYKALSLGKFDFSEPDFSFTTQFNPLDLITQLLPAQYDTVDVDGLPEIYCGMLAVVMLPIFYLNNKISLNKKIGYTSLLVVLFLCMYINPVDMVWHGFQEPNWLPYRYSFTFSFVMLLMGAAAFSKIEGIKASAVGGSAFCAAAFLAIAASRKAEHITTRELVFAVLFAAVYCVVIAVCRNNKKLLAVTAPIILLCVSSVELCYNAYNTFKDEDKDLVYSKADPWYAFIDNGREVASQIDAYNSRNGNVNDGFYRAEKTFHRTVNDTSALGLKGVSHSSSVMNARILKFLEAMGFSASTYYTRYDGNTPITDSLLGIKYSMDKNTVGDKNAKRLTNETYNPIFAYKYIDENKKEAVIDVYENPNVLSLGYAVDETVGRIAALGNDDVFMGQNILMSSIAGHTVIENDQFSQYREYFKKMDVNPDTFILNNVTTSPYGEQTMYTAGEEGDPTVNMHITAETADTIYMYFQTENQKQVNLWLSTEKDENGNYTNHSFVGSYFEGHDYHTVNLGQYEPGQEFELRMTVANEYTIVNSFHFYYFDQAAFEEDINKIKQQQWNITDFGGDSIEGTITINEGQLMLTSIPYEEGWTVKVDGEKVEFFDKDSSEYTSAEQCYTMYVNALMGLKLTPGEHTIEMSYTPPGLTVGIIALIAGIVCVVFIYRYDKKHNKVLIAMYRAKNAPVKQAEKNEKNSDNDGAEKTEETSEDKTESKNEEKISENTSSKKSNRKKKKKKR
ncbi:MAG: YfhO family protein [Oscillospiraceae bacterium]|nr:YfhO family protein [Oscillospiraceae bacterium]